MPGRRQVIKSGFSVGGVLIMKRLMLWLLLFSAGMVTAIADDLSALMDAIRRARTDEVSNLLANGAKPNGCASDYSNPLMIAAETGQAEMVRLLLAKGADISGTCTGEMTALMAAARHGRVEVVQLLVDKGANLNAKDFSGQTALMAAAEAGNAAIVKILLQKGADTHVQETMGRTAYDLALSARKIETTQLLSEKPISAEIIKTGQKKMMDAIGNGKIDIVREQLALGADVNARIDAMVPLEWALMMGREEIAKFLLEQGANINARGAGGATMLMKFAEMGSIESVRFLLQNGADTSVKNVFGQNAADLAKAHGNGDAAKLLSGQKVSPGPSAQGKLDQDLVQAVALNDLARARELLSRGASREARLSADGFPVLTTAASAGHLEMVRLLVEQGANVNAKGPVGMTALMLASSSGRTEIVRFLLDHGADFNAKAFGGQTAMLLAANEGRSEVVELLASRGSRIDPKANIITENPEFAELNKTAAKSSAKTPATSTAKSPAKTAAKSPKTAPSSSLAGVMGKLAIESRTSVSALINAAAKGDTATIKVLQQQGADINGVDINHKSALLSAAESRHPQTALYLIDQGANVNTVTTDGLTPVIAAARNADLEITTRLIEKGADVNAANREGHTALIEAVANGSFEIVKRLVEHGANVNALTSEGQSAMYFGYSPERAAKDALIFLYLIEHGADVNSIDHSGLTVLMAVSERCTVDVVKAVLDKGAFVNAKDKKRGATALIWCLIGHYYKPDVVRLLVERGADVNAADNNGLTPLMASPDPAFTQILLDRGANINAVHKNGKNALQMAACDVKMEKFLLDRGAKVLPGAPVIADAFSCEWGPCMECAKMFVNAGADINVPAWNGVTPLMMLVGGSNIDTAKEYLARGADVRARDKFGHTALHRVGFPEYVDLLVDRGADINARDDHQRTPILAANRHDVIAALVRRGANINDRDIEGQTLLFIRRGPDATEFLLANHANPSIRDNRGRTPLMRAVESDDGFSVKVLIKAGVDVNAVSKEGETAMSIAKRKHNSDLGKILLEAGAK
jgi:ankyrin repeat protein